MKYEELLKKALAGDDKAQIEIIHNLICEPDIEILKEYADLGWWAAQRYYCIGLATGKYGIERNPIELKRLADLGWNIAKQFYLEGIAEGRFGIEKDLVELKRLADQGWKAAQSYYFSGIAHGWYGLKKNEELAEELKTLWNLND